MKIKKLFLLLLIVGVTAGCGKDIEGTYSGTAHIQYTGGSTSTPVTVSIQVDDEDKATGTIVTSYGSGSFSGANAESGETISPVGITVTTNLGVQALWQSGQFGPNGQQIGSNGQPIGQNQMYGYNPQNYNPNDPNSYQYQYGYNQYGNNNMNNNMMYNQQVSLSLTGSLTISDEGKLTGTLTGSNGALTHTWTIDAKDTDED